ncbi:YraN family protein [Patescibacteria group bacterium]|nr:YraN family protein [Patescibacteria group bacterium]
MDRENTGKTGEKVAVNFLKEHGYEILTLNFKNNFGRRLGEIDIIAREKVARQIVFVEVKTRDFQKYQNTLPEENITYSKLRKLEKIAQFYLRLNHLSADNYRFDAISVLLDKENHKAQIRHLKNIYL